MQPKRRHRQPRALGLARQRKSTLTPDLCADLCGNLHFVWDTLLPANAFKNNSRDEIAALAKARAAEWAKGDAAAWASEAHDVAVKFTYGRLPVKLEPGKPPANAIVVDRDYVDASAPIVRQQLARAAVRLAYALNGALSN